MPSSGELRTASGARLVRDVAEVAALPEALPPTSLIICSRNRPALLADTVESILQGDEVPTELIIIDQSDVPRDVPAAWRTSGPCEIRHVPSRSAGLGRARNEGIAQARHDVLAFTDDDMYAAPGWFGALIRAMVEAGPRSAVTGRVLPGAEEVPGGFVPALVTSDAPATYEGRIDVDVLAGGNMAVRRSLIDMVGGFDDRLGAGSRFPAAEDNDLGFRLLEVGARIVYVPQAVLYHRAWRAARAYLPMRWSYGRGKGGYYAKHLSFRDRHMLRRAVRDVAHRVVRMPRHLLRNRRQALGDAVYILGILSGVTRWLATGKQGR
ncbi:MAG: glycosyltransferase [Gemmatimonadaceae bacterium]